MDPVIIWVGEQWEVILVFGGGVVGRRVLNPKLGNRNQYKCEFWVSDPY